jgi:putative flippase GtrA
MAGLRARIEDLRSPRSGLLGQLLRFGLAGSLVAVVYLTVTTLLYKVFGLPFQVALAVGFTTGLLLHFTLQRLFVWIHHEEFALPLHHQVGRYLAMAGTQYGITAASTAWLPGALGLETEVVYLLTMVLVTTGGFLLMRLVIFHAGSGGAVRPEPAPAAPALGAAPGVRGASRSARADG